MSGGVFARFVGCTLSIGVALPVAALASPSVAWASPIDRYGVVRIVGQRQPLRLATSTSNNWFGYNKGALEPGNGPFSSISASWRVPRARQRVRGQAEQSATWIGIGGGCVDTACVLTDASGLIQAGTEQDVMRSGRPRYSAWWELVPLPAVTISRMHVRPGDRMHAAVFEVQPVLGLWRVTLKDLTRRETFTKTVPYASSRASAEWIEETPLTLGTSGAGFAALPRLDRTSFSSATVNGHGAGLRPSERVRLRAGSRVIGTPSLPEEHGRGFVACSWTSHCSVRAR